MLLLAKLSPHNDTFNKQGGIIRKEASGLSIRHNRNEKERS